jgi:hypothetical protein
MPKYGRRIVMGLFEQNPWLMVPFIVAVVAAYDGLKLVVREVVRRQRQAASSSRG